MLKTRLLTIHNRTQELQNEELPYNSKNTLLSATDLCALLSIYGVVKTDSGNINLYRTAFVHPSYITRKNDDFEVGNERCPPDCLPLQDMSYQRLEFIGDAILGSVIATYLYERFPDVNEGFLSRVRTQIVNGVALSELSEKLNLGKYCIISCQIEENGGRENIKILEDTFEAFIGAIFGDFDYITCETFIVNVIEKHVDFSGIIVQKNNYKDMLVKHCQHNLQDAPKFFEVCIESKGQNKVFTVCVKNKSGMVLGTGKGSSKKAAEKEAAFEALKYLGVSLC